MKETSTERSEKMQAYRERQSQLMKAHWADPERHQWHCSRLKGADRTSEAARAGYRHQQEMYEDPEYRAQRWAKMKNKAKAARLTDDEVREVRFLLEQGYTQWEICQMFNVTQPVISYIKAGKTYKYVKDEE